MCLLFRSLCDWFDHKECLFISNEPWLILLGIIQSNKSLHIYIAYIDLDFIGPYFTFVFHCKTKEHGWLVMVLLSQSNIKYKRILWNHEICQ